MTDNASDLARTILDTLEEKKGEDILLLDLKEVCSFTDYFVVCTCASERTIKALGDEVVRRVKEASEMEGHARPVIPREGEASSGWVLYDFGEVILHLFSRNTREYYRLEELWKDGTVVVHVQ
jgi:ribosome-associated protein